jgi:hypothetical protein
MRPEVAWVAVQTSEPWAARGFTSETDAQDFKDRHSDWVVYRSKTPKVAQEEPSVRATKVEITFDDGRKKTLDFQADRNSEIDALFLSLSSVEKFLVPYYTSLYGTALAEQVRMRFTSAPTAALGHLPWTEYMDMTAIPEGEELLSLRFMVGE